MADTAGQTEAPGLERCVVCHPQKSHGGDDHPKVHVLGSWVRNPDDDEQIVVRNPSFHYDCLPQEWVDRYEGDPTHARLLETRRAAVEDGKRGADLAAYHLTLPDDNDPAIAEAYAAELEAQA